MKSYLAAATFATLTLTLCLLPAVSSAQEGAKAKTEVATSKDKKPAIDWKEVDATGFGAKLAKASAAGEKWAASPESIILEFAGPFVSKDGEKAAQSRQIRIYSKGEDLPKILNVVLIDDGLFDDSIKTARTRLALARGKDGSWKLRKAFRSQVKWPKR